VPLEKLRKDTHMSKLVIEVCEVLHVEAHPDAERLAIATVKGWKTCIKKDPETGETAFKVGEKCIFFPPDAVLPPALANTAEDVIPGRLGVRTYCAPVTGDKGEVLGHRVKATRLRGFPSFGVIERIRPEFGDDLTWEVGTDLAEHFGVTKWEPPVRTGAGDAAREVSLFHKYTNMENVGNYPRAIPEGTEVVFTEKLHGTNSRIGLVVEHGEDGTPVWNFMAGSHNVPRTEFDAAGVRSDYWMPVTDGMKALLTHLRDTYDVGEPVVSVLVFGEIFGSGVQDMAYGLANGTRAYRAFDVAVNGRYLDFDVKVELFAKFGIDMVPILYRGPFSLERLGEYTDGHTTMCDAKAAGKFKGREGVVCTAVKEQMARGLHGRMIVKSVSADYLARKGGTDSH
jgi:RNA ligase (TIGR02306 family)